MASLDVFPATTDTRAGREGSTLAIMTTLSPPDGLHNINLTTLESMRDFPTFAPDIQLKSGKWYYEVEIHSVNGALCIGYVTKGFVSTGRQNGVGDCKNSWGLDVGQSKLYNANVGEGKSEYKAKAGDVVGVSIDVDAHTIIWSINGTSVATVADFTQGSSYVVGNSVQPGVSIAQRQKVKWNFTADSFKFAPAGFEPLQAVPFPPVYSLDPKTLTTPDLLSDTTLLSRLLEQYAPTSTAADEKTISKWLDTRGFGLWEYGFNTSCVNSITNKIKEASNAFEGELPKLAYKRGSFARDWEAAEEEFDKIEVLRRALTQWTVVFLTLWGRETAAGPTVEKIKGLDTLFKTSLAEANLKRRFVAARENRKTNGFCEYGIQYSIGGVVNTMKEDRTRMDANKLKAFVEELGQKIAKLRGWRAWFVAQVGDIPFHTTQLDELDALIAQYDAMFDPKAMEKEAIAKALERCTKDLENVVRIGRSNIKDALAEFARFPERAEEKYRTMNEQLEKYKADAAAAAASGEEPTAASVAALGVAAVTDTPLFKEWQGELSAATANWRVAEDRRRLEREAQDATRECKGLISRGHDLLYHSNIPAALEHLHEAREKVAELKLRPGFLSLPLVNEFFTEYEAEKYKLETGITAWQLDRATSDAARELRDAADHTLYLFSHYRNEEALENHYKTETLRKEMEAKREWAAVPAIKEILERVKPQSVQFIRDYKERVVTRQAEDAVSECSTALDFATGHLDHHRHEMCLDELQKCKDKTEALRNDAMLSTIPVAVAWLARYAEEVPALQRKYDSIMLEREIDEALRLANGAFDEVEDHFNHYRFEYALTSLEKYRSLGDQLDKEKRFAGDAKVEEFLGKFDSNIADFTTRYRDTMLKREFDEKIRSANDTINNADYLFSHSRFEEAIAALQAYRDLLTELSASKFDPITERDEYVRVAREEKIPAWLTKYKTEVLSRKGAEVARELSMAASTAKDHFSHHRDELFLAALDVLRQKMKDAEPAKDDTGDARMTYELPAVQDALKEAATAVWEMSQDYNQRTQDKKVDEALRNIRTLLDQANYLFSHSRFDESLSEFAKARDAAADLSSAAFAAGVARVSEYLTTFATSAKEFETKFDEGMRARRRAEAERAVNMAFSSAKDMFAHYRNDDSLKELNKASEAVLTFESEFTKPEDVAAVAAWRAGFATFEQEYNSRVLTREAEDAVAKAKAELTFAEGHSDHSRFENALESLQASLAAAAAIAVNARFRSLPVVVAFEAEFAPRVGAFKVAFERKMQDRQASELLRGLTDALGEMEQHFQHHRMQNALESFAAVKEKRAALQVEPLSQRPDVVAAYADAGKRMDTFQQNYRESVLATKLRESTSAALAKLTEAEDMLKHSRFDESLESFQTSRELAGAVGADEMLNGMAAVESFLKDFGVRAEAFRSLHSSTVRARAQAEGRRVIGGDLDLAKQHFDHSRNEDALLSLSKARDALSAFEVEWAGSDAVAATFVSESRATMASLEKAFAEKMFKQELERKMGKARSRLTASSDALAHHRHDEAMRVLVEADESAAVLASDDRFLRLEAVDVFLKEHKAASQELRAKIDASLKEKAAAEVSRTARDLAGEAERLYEHHRLEEALANASKLKSLIEDDLATNPLLTTLASELTTRLRTFQERFQREHLAREADSLIRGADSQLESARFLLDHHRAEEALEAVQKARDFAATLGDDVRFGGVAAVDAFFAAWAGRVSATCAAITDRMLSRRARDAIADVRSPLTEATQYLDKNVYEQALERLSQATDRASALRDDKELSKVESVRTFLAEFDKERTALAARVAREVYGKEVDAALRTVRGHLDAATALFERFAFEGALKEFHEASDAVDVVKGDERLAKAEAWVAFATGEWKQRSGAFAQKYSERVLGDEARTLANEVRALIGKAKIFLERGVRDKTEEALDEARKAAAPLLDSNGLLQALDVATAVKNELAAIQLAFAQQYLVAEATAALTAARKQLQLAARAQTRALSADESLTAAREAVDALLGPSAEEPIKPLFAALPEVAAFVSGELAPALAGAGLELFKKVAGGAAGGAGGKGGKVDTVDAALGPRFPQLAALRKGLPQIPVDTSVHPKYFSALKITNMAAKSIQGQLKQLETAVKACDLSLDAEHPTALFANEVATYPIESIERSLIDFGKGVAQVQEFKDEELAQQLINGLESFTAVFRESVAVLKKFSSLTAKARAMMWCKNLLAKMMAEADDITQSSQPQNPELRGYTPGHNPLNLGFEKHDDATFLLFIEATALKSAEMLQGWVDGEFAGVSFPRKDQFLEGFAATAVEAKRKHALHCILRMQQLWWNKKEVREAYMQALARFPLARAEALARYKNYTEFATERRDDLNDRDELVDPWADGGAPDADPDEKPEWYLEDFVLVQPGPSNGLALNKLQEQTADPKVYTAARKALDGRIVFSAAPIADTGDAKDAPLSDKFNLAEVTAGRGLFARAFWPHSLRNYALAKRRDNGAPIYGPEFLHNDRIRAEIMVFVRIDGKEIKRDNQPYGSFTWFTESCGAAAREGKKYKLGTTGDFWAWNQTCRLSVLRDDVHLERRMAEDWEASAARFAYEFSKLSAGDHKVEIDLRWRAVPTSDARILHKDKRTVFLNVTSELSEPLATGSFTLVVPATPVPRRSVLPITNPALSGSKADLENIEKALLKHMGSLPDWGRRSPRTEEPLICRLQSETYESEYAWFAVDGQRGVVVKEAVQRARDFVAAFRRLKETGWERDSVAFFTLAAYGVKSRPPSWDSSSITGIGVAMGGHFSFDLELLSEADLALLS